MVRRTEFHIPVKELTKVSFSCDTCQAVIIIDTDELKQRKKITNLSEEKRCSACGSRFAHDLFTALAAIIAFSDLARDKKLEKCALHFVLSDIEETET